VSLSTRFVAQNTVSIATKHENEAENGNEMGIGFNHNENILGGR